MDVLAGEDLVVVVAERSFAAVALQVELAYLLLLLYNTVMAKSTVLSLSVSG